MENIDNKEEFIIGKADLPKITLNGNLAEFAADVCNGIVRLSKQHPLVQPVSAKNGKIFVDQVLRTMDRAAIYGETKIKNKNGDEIKNLLPQDEPSTVEDLLKMYTANGLLKLIGADGSVIVFIPAEMAKKIRDKKNKTSFNDLLMIGKNPAPKTPTMKR